VFAPNPFRSQDGFDTLLHSGDIGKRLPDGNILYLNRQDWMIKINGQRVEPGEIEAEIRRLDDISDAAVKDFKDSIGQTFLTAYYISDYEKNEQDLKKALQKVLPSYMIPSRFMRLESFPVNANGKLDRKALPRPSFEERINKYIAPENETQKIITEAFAKILSVKQVGINDDFFSLGGDSIKVIMLQSALREKGFNISAGNIFEAPTPARLAEILKVHEESNTLADYRGHSADSWPLTQAQMSIYLDSQAGDKQTAYNIAFGLFLPSDMKPDSEKLKSAAELVLNKYPVLTAKVTLEEESPSLILSGSKIAVSVQETEIINHSDLVRRINKPFNLETGPLVRAEIFVTPEGLLLAIIIHHLVCDGTSVSILVENIANEYNGLPSHEEKMSNLTLAQYEYEHKSGHSEDMSVYRKMLDKLDGETLIDPDDDPALKANAGKSGIYKTTLFDGHEELAGMITPILAKNNLTESSLFMGAYAYLLHLLSQQKNILFFAGENGRHDPVLQNTVGMMVHNIPVCMQIESSEHSTDFMRRLQNQFYNLVSHDGADFASLYNEYKIKPDYFFVYQGEMLSGVTIGGRYIPLELYDSEEAMTSLTLHVFKQNTGDYRLRFEYSAGLFSEDTVKRIAEIYIQIIAGLCRDDELRNIRLVNDGTLTEMDSFNRTEADFPVTDIVSMFREAVKKYPDNNAVIFGDEILTYREVDDISERIACYISSMNIGKGEVVSILIPRCNYMVTASLGVLKSGAAYQPLDPTYPAERLNFMMKDADCRLLIADEALLEKVSDYKGPVLLTKDIPGLKDSGKLEKNPSP
ncbi:MAG: AMP-binding protein, partial [Synergistaceae bacterium]|nr:AMP-binding protein [Synergistaceae bacterium]